MVDSAIDHTGMPSNGWSLELDKMAMGERKTVVQWKTSPQWTDDVEGEEPEEEEQPQQVEDETDIEKVNMQWQIVRLEVAHWQKKMNI